MAAHDHHGANALGLAAPERAGVPADGLTPLGAAGAAAAGLTAGHKDEARELGSAAGFWEHTEPNNADSAHDALVTQPAAAAEAADEKAFSTLQARLALRGFALTRTDGAGRPVVYTVMRWGLVRELPRLEDVTAFADRVGAPA